MKILVVNQFFWPDVAATGQFLTDLTRHLGQEHEVTVICSGGSYADAAADDDPPPVKIVRVPGIRYQRGALARILSYATFSLGALWNELRLPKHDVVITMTTPPMLAVGGALLKQLRGSKHYIWEMDLFPDAFVSLGMLKENSWALKFLGWIEDACRRRSDGIITLGSCMRRKLIDRKIPRELIHIAENWADGDDIPAGAPRKSRTLNILYSGNLGLSHDTDTILGAIRHFRNDPRFVFTFSGGGVGKAELEKCCTAEGLDRVRFLPYSNRDQIGKHLAKGDIGLVTEHPGHIGIVVPSKIYGVLAAARPILFIGPKRSTADLLIRRFGFGWQIDPGDQTALIALLERLASDRAEIRRRGRRARRIFERHYDRPRGVARIAAIIGAGSAAQPAARSFSRVQAPLGV